jgi:phosphoribosylformimino-5-aminoimidazole carboxamide ribotide isomerase
LYQGDYDRSTVYGDDPVAQAGTFVTEGARWVHMVDLDAAKTGAPKNRDNIAAVARSLSGTGTRLQVGGGIRDDDSADALLGAGVERVVVGTAALERPTWLRELARRHPGRVAVGLDARHGKVAVEGWSKNANLSAFDLAKRFEDAGIAAIVYTDIARDGMLQGLNLDATIALADAVNIPVIASGGLASLDDIKKLLEPRAGKLEGAIAGRALYDGRLDAKAALDLIRAAKAG